MAALAKSFSREARAIESNLRAFDEAGQQMGVSAQAIGAILTQVKGEIPRGQFQDWLEENWSRTSRMARMFMQFARQTREIECVTPALLKSHWTEICNPAPKRKFTSAKDVGPQRTYDGRTPCPRCKGTGYIEGGPDIIEAEIVPQSKPEPRGTLTSEEARKQAFEEARVLYPGTKRGIDTEWANFRKKTKDYKTVAPDLVYAVRIQIAVRLEQEQKGEFVPPWKHFQTWINNRWWETADNV